MLAGVRSMVGPWLRGLLVGVAAMAAGCASAPRAGSSSGESGPEGVDQVELASIDVLPPMDFGSPSVRAAENGLEVLWFVAYDEQGQVGAALAPYAAQPLPISEEMAQAWKANGLRMVRLPLDDLASVQANLPVVGIFNRQWMGWALEWREAFRGRQVGRGATILLDGRRTELPAGALRLIARSWTAPSRTGVVVRLELAAQLFEKRGARSLAEELEDRLSRTPSAALDARGDGRVFDRLAIEAELTPGYVYVITAESPEVDWEASRKHPEAAAPEEPRPTLDERGFRVVPGAETPRSAGPAVGPEFGGLPTLGEALLAADAVGPGERRAKAIVVLAPRGESKRAPATDAGSSPRTEGAGSESRGWELIDR